MTKCTERREGGREGEAEGDRPRQIPSHANHNNKRQDNSTMTAGKPNTSWKAGSTVTVARQTGSYSEMCE